jgi:hypothetical protein
VGVDKYDNQSQIAEVFRVEHLASGQLLRDVYHFYASWSETSALEAVGF